MRSHFRVALCLLVASALVSGCASRDELARRIAGRWGPDPIIDPHDAGSVVERQRFVLKFISAEAGIPKLDPLNDPRWFAVAQWGFNIGREDCAIYLNNIFKIQREKQRNHDLLNSAQVATTAIVTATAPHSAKALSVLGQAFGLTIAANDTILQSYLFTEAPGLISIKIKQLQDKYQDGVLQKHVTSAASAYSALQNYYNICLPQSIEGVVLERVATSQAVNGEKSKTGGGTASSSVRTTPLLRN